MDDAFKRIENCLVRIGTSIDDLTPQEIEEVIIASQGDSFWRSNILSTKKLREKFSQLVQKFKPNQSLKFTHFKTISKRKGKE